MKKILFFIENLSGGGAEKVLCELVNHMDQSKFAITVQTLWPKDAAVQLAAGVKYKSVYPKRNTLYQNVMRLEAALGLIYPLHMKGDYDIEVAYLECGTTKILSQSTNKQAKKVAWVHCDLAAITDDPQHFAEKTAAQYAKFDQVVCVSENSLDSFVQMYGKNPEAQVIHNVIDDQAIQNKAAQPMLQDKRRTTVVSLGRLMHQKQYLRLLKVHKRLMDEGILHDLWIAGEGEERPLLENYIRENSLEDSAKLLGFQRNPYPLMREADLLVCSSLFEGLSTFLTEGLILGKPIVTTDCSGMHELLGDNEFGLITENSEEGLYQGMKKMLQDPALLQSYAQKASQRGRNFSMAALVRENETFFETL